jgi:hypothetical protein
LRCRAACNPGKNFLPSASRRLFGNRHPWTKVELRARCANETPQSNSYSYCKPNSNINADSTTKSNINADSNCNINVYSNPDSDGRSHSYVYPDSYADSYSHSYGDVHADTDGDCNCDGNSRSHSYSNPYSHGGCACFAWRD